MVNIATFNKDNYQTALLNGLCEPYGIYAPFINVDPIKYDNLRNETTPPDLCFIQKRLSNELFADIRGSISLTLRYAWAFFPAYEFFVNEFINDEWLSSVDWHKFHRDHIIHQPMSVYVGLSLLRLNNFPSGNLRELCLDSFRQSNYIKEYLEDLKITNIYRHPFILEPLFIDTFFLATLFHDIGYPWKFANTICEKLDKHAPSNSPSNQTTEKILSHYGKRLLFYPFNGYKKHKDRSKLLNWLSRYYPLNSYKKSDLTHPYHWKESICSFITDGMVKTHGMPGAISFLYLNDIFRKYPENDSHPLRRFCLEWAAMAIMMHDMADFYAVVDKKTGLLKVKNPQLRLSIEKDPLSFMLTLTDQIQDFNRPDAIFSPNDKSVNVEYSRRCCEVSLDWDEASRVLTIKYGYNNSKDYLENKNNFLPKNQLQYFDPHHGYLDYSGLGISEIRLEAELKR